VDEELGDVFQKKIISGRLVVGMTRKVLLGTIQQLGKMTQEIWGTEGLRREQKAGGFGGRIRCRINIGYRLDM